MADSELKEGRDGFPVSVIGDANHAGLLDGGVRQQQLFDLARIDIFTSYDPRSLG